MAHKTKARRGVAPRRTSDAILTGKLDRGEDKPSRPTTQPPALHVERAGMNLIEYNEAL